MEAAAFLLMQRTPEKKMQHALETNLKTLLHTSGLKITNSFQTHASLLELLLFYFFAPPKVI